MKSRRIKKIIGVMGIWILSYTSLLNVQAENVNNTKGSYEKPTIEVESVMAKAGEEFTVDINIYNNPGIVSMGFDVIYDMEKLTFTDVTFDELLGTTVMKPQVYESGSMLNWINGLKNLNVKDYRYATLHFTAKEVVDGTEISVDYNPNNLFNIEETEIAFDTARGVVTVYDESNSSTIIPNDDEKAQSGTSNTGNGANGEKESTTENGEESQADEDGTQGESGETDDENPNVNEEEEIDEALSESENKVESNVIYSVLGVAGMGIVAGTVFYIKRRRR